MKREKKMSEKLSGDGVMHNTGGQMWSIRPRLPLAPMKMAVLEWWSGGADRGKQSTCII